MSPLVSIRNITRTNISSYIVCVNLLATYVKGMTLCRKALQADMSGMVHKLSCMLAAGLALKRQQAMKHKQSGVDNIAPIPIRKNYVTRLNTTYRE